MRRLILGIVFSGLFFGTLVYAEDASGDGVLASATVTAPAVAGEALVVIYMEGDTAFTQLASDVQGTQNAFM